MGELGCEWVSERERECECERRCHVDIDVWSLSGAADGKGYR